jgi:CHAD domain-containing protein
VREVLEREEKWEVDDRFEVPDLASLFRDARVEHDVVDLVSEYYDTPERDLQAHRVSLRRRSGDDDTGWHVKLPAADGRTELHWPLTDAAPKSLLDLLIGVGLGKTFDHVATVHTVRSRHRVRDASEELYAELADDQVRASAGDQLLAWREVEVELGPSATSMPKGLVKRLRAAGARPSRHPSKLAHVLPPPPTVEPDSSAARAVVDYLDAQITAIVAGDIGLRRGQDPIHDTRVAMRRLRSTLRVFASVLDESAVGGLEDELRWFAGLLGEVRDCQVQRQRFGQAVDELPADLVLGPVRSRVHHDLQAVELPARAAVREAMDSSRYLAILAVLRRWRDAPPVLPGTTTAQLRTAADKARRKADRRLAAAMTEDSPTAWHRARKACKRARYAAELCQGLGKSRKDERTVQRYKQFQSVLGDHQDAVVAAESLRRMGVAAGTTTGENGFTFGVLLAGERRTAQECRMAARELAG